LKADLKKKFFYDNNLIYCYFLNNTINFNFEDLSIFTKLQNLLYASIDNFKSQDLNKTIRVNNLSIMQKQFKGVNNNNIEDNMNIKSNDKYFASNNYKYAFSKTNALNDSKIYLGNIKEHKDKESLPNDLNQTFDLNKNKNRDLNDANNPRNLNNISFLNSYNANDFKYIASLIKDNNQNQELYKSYNDSAVFDLKKSTDFNSKENYEPTNHIEKLFSLSKSKSTDLSNLYNRNNSKRTGDFFNNINLNFGNNLLHSDNFIQENLITFKEFVKNEFNRMETLANDIESEKIVFDNLKKAIDSKISQDKVSSLKINESLNQDDKNLMSPKYNEIIEGEKRKLKTKESFLNNFSHLFEKIYELIIDFIDFVKNHPQQTEFIYEATVKKINNIRNQIIEFYKFYNLQVKKNGNEIIIDNSNKMNNNLHYNRKIWSKEYNDYEKGYYDFEQFYRKHKFHGLNIENYT